MKIKQQPGDFRVEEKSRLEAGPEGVFTLYRLEKTGLDTPAALRLVARAWKLATDRISFAGLKDRYGVTGQVISIRKGPARNFSGRGLKLNYLGRSPRPATRGTIERNEFAIVVRHLNEEQAGALACRARAAARWGIPNYFDDQRFGSLRGTGGAFVARALLDGDHETALRLTVAAPARADRSRLKRRRKLLRDRWGSWRELAELLEPSFEQRVCERLAAGSSFAEAYAQVDPALRSLHLAAFQAHLFNECLRRAVGEGGPSHPGLAGGYRFYRGDPGDLRGLRFALASAAAQPEPLLDAILEEGSLDREVLARLPFRSGTRAAVAVPREVAVAGPERDEINPGRVKIALSFALGPGSYATMLVKRCTYDT